jgi:DNA-binding YbaB/EbfC family protein
MRDIMKLLQQAQDMQGQLKKIQDDLENLTVTGSAAGGMVTAEVNGQGLFKRVKLDPSMVNSNDVAMLEDLIAVAVSDAQRKAAEKAQEQTSKLAGGMNLPFKLPGF